jgi:hypothetical protein
LPRKKGYYESLGRGGGEKFVTYGEKIILVHVYTKSVVSVIMGSPANQSGSFEVALEKDANQFSVFCLMPSNKSSKRGATVLNSDSVLL